MWFGTRAYMQTVRDPDVSPDYEVVGWGETTQYLNGGLGVSASATAHREYTISWSSLTRDQVRQITDYADGVYGTGLIYWLDPVAMDKNVLPQSWATPALGGRDAVPLAGNVRPPVFSQSDQSQGYPTESAEYTMSGATVVRPLFIPVPSGYTAWFGVHGSSATNFVKVTPYTGASAGTPVYPAILGVNTTTRVNTSVSSVTGIQLSLNNGVTGSGILTGMIVQILPTGATPATGGFISGQGHSGCRFIGRPTVVPETVASGLEVLSVTAKLGEVGAWE